MEKRGAGNTVTCHESITLAQVFPHLYFHIFALQKWADYRQFTGFNNKLTSNESTTHFKATPDLTFTKALLSQSKVSHFHQKDMNSDRIITLRRLYYLLQLARLPEVHKKRCHFNIAIFQVIFLDMCLLILHYHVPSHVPYGHVDRTTFDTKYDSGGTF